MSNYNARYADGQPAATNLLGAPRIAGLTLQASKMSRKFPRLMAAFVHETNPLTLYLQGFVDISVDLLWNLCYNSKLCVEGVTALPRASQPTREGGWLWGLSYFL